MKSKIQIMLVIILLGAAYGGYNFYDFQTNEVPKLEADEHKGEAEIATKQGELKRLQNFKVNIETVKQELKELNLQLESALEYMPRAFELSKLLRRLTTLAQNSGVELSSFKPKKTEEKKSGSFYSTVAIDFDLKGSFTQTLVFLDQLSRLKRIINIDSLKLRSMENPQRTGAVAATTTASVRTYRFAE